MRDIYALMFKYHRFLPDEVGRQSPYVLFKMLDTLDGEERDFSGNEHLRMFYGQ